MRHKKLVFALSAVLIAGVAATWNFSRLQEEYKNTNPHVINDKTLVYCIGKSPRALSPALVADGTSYNSSSRIIFNRLVENKAGSTELSPALAESWYVSPDSKEYTLYLRHGVKFNDNDIFKPSRDFNADDVLFTFNRMLDKEHPYHKVNNATYPYWYGMNLNNLIDKVEKVNDYTVKFTLNEPNVTFISTLAMDVLSIYSAEYADFLAQTNQQELIDKKPLGTGPWKLDQMIPDTSIRYIANENYFRGPAKVGTVIFSITPDSNSRLAKLITGACDFIDRPNTANLNQVIKDYGLKSILKTGLNVAYLGLNHEFEPLKDPRVRHALDIAIDKKAISRLVYNDEVTVDNHVLTETLLGYDSSATEVKHDPEEAKRLLAEAGYPNGFDIEIFVQPVARSSNPNPKRTAELIQQDWAAIGVNAKLTTTEYQDFIKQTRAGNFQTGTYGWSGDNGDSDNFLGPLLSTPYIGKNNYSRYSNPEFDALLLKARTTSDLEERKELYRQAEKIAIDKTAFIVIGHSKLLAIMSPRVIGYQQTPFGFSEFYDVDVLPKK